MKLSNGIRKALLVSMAALLAGSLVFTGCKGSDDSSDPIRQMILLQQIENAKTLQQKIDESGAVLDLGGAVKANDAVISKAMTLKNVNLGGKTLTVKASGVVLEGVQSAKIVVSKDIADGDFTMKNCAAIEKVTVNGGGSNSVHIEGSVVQSLAVAKAGVRIALKGKSRIESAAVKADGIILVGNAESTVAKVALASGVKTLALAGGNIAKIVSKTAVKIQIKGNGTKISQVKSSAAIQFEKDDDVDDFEEVAIEELDDDDWDDADFEGWDDEDEDNPEDEDDPEDEEPEYQITSLVKPFSDASWTTTTYGSGVAADFVQGEQLKVAVTQADMDLVEYSNGIQAKHDITDVIADGKTYIVRFYITADVDAKAKWSVMSGEPNYQWYGGADLDLVAGERQKVEGLVDLNSSAASDAFLPSLKTTLGLDFLSVANFTVENIEFGEYTVVEVESVSLNETAKTIFVGEEFELAATVAPEDATFKKVTWSSSDPAVATVDSGKVKAVAHGKATITAKAGEREATCEVTVAEFSLSETSRTIEPEASFELKAIVYPENTEVTWASSNPDVAEYSDGHVNGKAEGTAKITATAMGKTLECEVTVSSNVIPVESVAFEKDGKTINVGDKIDLPAVVVLPEKATNKNPKFAIDPESVARITEEGKIVAVSAGTATLTASAGGKTDTYTITVMPRVIEQPELTNMKLFVETDTLIYKVESNDVVGAAEFTAGTKVKVTLPVNVIYERGGVTARNVTMQVVDNSEAADWWTIISDPASCELVEGQTAVWEATIKSDITSDAKAVIFFQIPGDEFTPATKKELLYVNAELPPESEPGVLFEDADGWSEDWSAKTFQASDFETATNDSYLVFTVSKDTNKYYEQDRNYENCYAIIQMMYANADNKFGAGTSNTTVENATQLNLRGDNGLFEDADDNTLFRDVEYHPTAEEWAEIKANGMKIQAHGVMFKKIAIK